MSTSTPTAPTAAELNVIQAKWMALQSEDPEWRKREVYAAMEAMPKSYVSASPDLKTGAPIISGGIVWASRRPIAEATEYVRAYGVLHGNSRCDVVWIGATGLWAATS